MGFILLGRVSDGEVLTMALPFMAGFLVAAVLLNIFLYKAGKMSNGGASALAPLLVVIAATVYCAVIGSDSMNESIMTLILIVCILVAVPACLVSLLIYAIRRIKK